MTDYFRCDSCGRDIREYCCPSGTKQHLGLVSEQHVVDAALRYRAATTWLKLRSPDGRQAASILDAYAEDHAINDAEFLVHQTVQNLREILNMAKDLGLTNPEAIEAAIKELDQP